jgi:hypothetical protein
MMKMMSPMATKSTPLSPIGGNENSKRKYPFCLLSVFFFCACILSISCKDRSLQPEQTGEWYDYMLFDRTGGGNLEFRLSPTEGRDTFVVTIDKISYRDTILQSALIPSVEYKGMFDTLARVLSGQLTIEGAFRQSTLPTGTWANIYVVNKYNKKEVTDTALRSTLLRFEPIVRVLCLDAMSMNPFWVDSMISRFQEEPVGNPPQSIWRYEYNGQLVYYIPPQCCDQFSVLFDVGGRIICAPDGGLTGQGDGHCPDFFQERKNEKLIWHDHRQR